VDKYQIFDIKAFMVDKYNQKNIYLEQELTRRVIQGLSCEWENALWVLPEKYRGSITKPLFCIRDMKKRLGCWSGEKREICLSKSLVFNHPWDAVCDVLRHEMAHQFAHEVLGSQGESMHGPSFQRACHLLRADPKANGDYKSLDERVKDRSADNNDRIMARVKKLLALAKSHNNHEAEAAMAKAHELILKYNIDLLSCKKEREFISVFVGNPALRHFREEYHLASLLIDYYFVEGLWVPSYVLEKEKVGRVLEITGTLQNVKIASYVYDFIKRFIDSKWDEYNSVRGMNRFRKTDFAVGIIEGFRSRLEKRSKAVVVKMESLALAKVEDPLLKKYTAYKYPNTRSFTRRASGQDENVLNDGKKEGKKMVISKGITEKKERGGILIGHGTSG
jgi:hypothetical protein